MIHGERHPLNRKRPCPRQNPCTKDTPSIESAFARDRIHAKDTHRTNQMTVAYVSSETVAPVQYFRKFRGGARPRHSVRPCYPCRPRCSVCAHFLLELCRARRCNARATRRRNALIPCGSAFFVGAGRLPTRTVFGWFSASLPRAAAQDHIGRSNPSAPRRPGLQIC